MPERPDLTPSITAWLEGTGPPGDAFAVVRDLARQYARSGNSSELRSLVIQALERANELEGSSAVLYDIARELGLFPYLNRNQLDSREAIAFEYHRVPALGKSVVFHRAQLTVLQRLLRGEDVVLSAPTSFGKSLLIDAVIAIKQPQTVVVIVPTIALIDETRRRLQRRFAHLYKIVTHSQQVPGSHSIYVLTQERLLERSDLDGIDLLVVDEFYKLSPVREDSDNHRSDLLNAALMRFLPRSKQLYMLGPSIRSLHPGVPERLATAFLQIDEPMVASRLHMISDVEPLEHLPTLMSGISGPTIVFVRSPERAAEAVRALMKSRAPTQDSPVRALSRWTAANFHPDWHVTKALRRGMGVHHARLPRGLAAMIVHLFNSQHLDWLVCTSTLIEGVNTVAQNVVILDHEVNRRPIDYFTFNNIRGRSGRLLKHFVGHVYVFSPPPTEDLPWVDIPVFTQSERLSDSLLFELDEAGLTTRSKKRRQEIAERGILSQETVRENRGVDVEDQLAAAVRIQQELTKARRLLRWNRVPEYEQLRYACSIIWKELRGSRLGRGVVRSDSQLTYLVNKLAGRPTPRELIESRLQYHNHDADASTNAVLGFLRSWAEFNYPHLLLCLGRIANDVFQARGVPLINVEPHATLVQRLFRDICATAFEEYGIPMQLTDKISREVQASNDLDRSIDKLRELDIDELHLTAIERRFLRRAQRGLG